MAKEWQPIETAPRDGTEITTGRKSEWVHAFDFVAYPIKSKFLDGKWVADFGGDIGWSSYDPQPSHWLPSRSKPNQMEEK